MNAEEFMSQYTSEYIGRLAYSRAQFWTADEDLPTDEAREDEIFYRVSIRRLSGEERLSLVTALRNKADVNNGFFDREFCESRCVRGTAGRITNTSKWLKKFSRLSVFCG